MMRSRRSDRGVGIIAVIMIVAILSVMGAVVTLLVATGAISKTNDLVREQAFALGHAGFEYALKQIDDGTDPDGQTRSLGSGQFTVDYGPTGVVTISPSVSAMQGAASPTFTVQGPVSGGVMGDCLVITTTGAYTSSNKRIIYGVTLRNNCQVAITIAGMTDTWSPNGGERLQQIVINGTTVYNSGTGVLSGTAINITDVTIPPCTTIPLTSISFNNNINKTNHTLLFAMSDGSSKQGVILFNTDDEAACFDVNVSGASIGYTGYTRLLGITITNICPAPTIATIKHMTVSWTTPGTTPSRRTTAITLAGTSVWTGSATSGTEVNVQPDTDITAGQTINQDFITFNGDMRGFNFTINYRLGGTVTESNKLVTVNLYEMSPAACLRVVTAGTSIGGTSNRDLLGEVWQNTCPLRVVVDRVRTTWSGSSRTLQAIVVGGTSVWTGSASSNTVVDIANVDLPGSSSVAVDRYRWNNGMVGRSFTHTMYPFPYSTGGSVAVPSFSP